MNSLTKFWWVKLPRLAGRFALTPATALTDGIYLPAINSLTNFLSPILFIIGLLIGWFHPGFNAVFSESLFVVIFIVMIGVFSGHLGLMFLCGFISGDFFLSAQNSIFYIDLNRNTFNVILLHFALIIEYALLSMALCQIPVITKYLLSQFYVLVELAERFKFGNLTGIILALIGHPLITGVLVFFWCQAIAFLIRPVFTWGGSNAPIIQAIQPIQAVVNSQDRTVGYIVFTAVLASVIRIVFQAVVSLRSDYSSRLEALENEIAAVEIKPLTEKFPKVIRWGFSSIWGAFLLSGVYQNWIQGIIFAAVLFGLQFLRTGIFGWWVKAVNYVPLIIRLVGVAVAAWIVAQVIIDRNKDSFSPFFFLIVITCLLFALVTPKSESDEEFDSVILKSENDGIFETEVAVNQSLTVNPNYLNNQTKTANLNENPIIIPKPIIKQKNENTPLVLWSNQDKSQNVNVPVEEEKIDTDDPKPNVKNSKYVSWSKGDEE